MYKVLIVDDEPVIREGLEILIDWNKYGFDVADTAEDGIQALNKLKAQDFQLIVTDIRMPELSGLELIERISNQNPMLKILILSGYNDFEYAKKAIEHGVKGYLLKPINKMELIQQLINIKKELDKLIVTERIEKQNTDIAKNKLMLDIALGSMSRKEAMAKADLYGIDLTHTYYISALIEINNITEILEGGIDDVFWLKYAVRNIAEEIMTENCVGFVYEDIQSFVGIIYCGDDSNENICAFVSCLEKIYSAITNFLCANITIGVGEMVTDILEIKNSRLQAQRALERRIIAKENRIITYHKIMEETPIWDLKWDFTNLFFLVENGSTSNLKTEIDNLMGELIKNAADSHIIQAMKYNVVFGLCAVANKYEIDPANIFSDKDLLNLKTSSFDIGQIYNFIYELCLKASSIIKEHCEGTLAGIIVQVKDYINKNYDKDLNVKNIANHFYINSAYLGQVFKNTVGETINEYINKIRIGKVKELIEKQPGSKVYKTIEKVGYKNHEHFYRQFKRYEGISFAEYHAKAKQLGK